MGLLLDQKGFTILTFLFGMDLAILDEKHGKWVLFRRLLFLLMLGLAHMFLVFSGDILTLYGLCAMLLLPGLRLPAPALAAGMLGLLALRLKWNRPTVPYGISGTDLIALTRSEYSHSSWLEVVHFRFQEVGFLIGPLLVNIAPRTLAVMLLGVLVWRSKGLNRLARSGPLLWWGGLTCSLWEAHLLSSGKDPGRLLGDCGILGLSLGYAGLILGLPSDSALVRLFAPLGRVAPAGPGQTDKTRPAGATLAPSHLSTPARRAPTLTRGFHLTGKSYRARVSTRPRRDRTQVSTLPVKVTVPEFPPRPGAT